MSITCAESLQMTGISLVVLAQNLSKDAGLRKFRWLLFAGPPFALDQGERSALVAGMRPIVSYNKFLMLVAVGYVVLLYLYFRFVRPT